MSIERFEDVIAWQKARVLTLGIYRLFESSRDFSFRDQIQRAALSIMNNIAEGFEHNTNNEFKYFLYVAKGSCGEVRSMLLIARDLNKIEANDFAPLYELALNISKMLSGLIKSLK